MDSVKESTTSARHRAETKTASPSSSSSPDSSSSSVPVPETSMRTTPSPGSHNPITSAAATAATSSSSSSPLKTTPSSTSAFVASSHNSSSTATFPGPTIDSRNQAASASDPFPGDVESGSCRSEAAAASSKEPLASESAPQPSSESHCTVSMSEWTEAAAASPSEKAGEERKAETASPEGRGHNKRKPGQGLAAADVCSSSAASSASKAASPSSSEAAAAARKDGRKHRHHHHRNRRGSASPTSAKKSRSGSVGANSSSEKGSAHNSSDSEDEHRMMIDEDVPNDDELPVSNSSPAGSGQGQAADTFSSKPGSPDASSSSPKVPPLRIVISKSNSTPTPGSVTSAEPAHSFSQRVTSSTSISSSTSVSAKSLPHLVVSSSATLSTSSSNHSSSLREDGGQDGAASDDEASNTSATSGTTNADGKSGSTSGRVTRSSQRVKEQQHQDPHASRSSHHNLRDRGRDKDTDESDSQATSPTSTSSKETRDDGGIVSAATASSAKGEVTTRKRKVVRTKASSVSGASSTPEKVTRSSEKNLRDSGRGKEAASSEPGLDEDNESTSSSTSSASGSKEAGAASDGASAAGLLKSKEFSVPSYNSYQMYLNIRKAIGKRRKNLMPVQPNPPKGFKDYLMIRGGYLLKESMSASSAIPTSAPSSRIPGLASPPADLSPGSALYNLFVAQEGERHRLRIQHTIEKEKLRLSYEQEILRVHGRAALAVANQTVPYSFCSIIKDDEIYNMIEQENESDVHDAVAKSEPSSETRPGSSGPSNAKGNDYSKNTYTNSSSNAPDLTALTGGPSAPGSRSRYNGRLFLSWIQDVTEKWDKIKMDTILRQRRESESLLAIQKLDWEWKMKELLLCDFKTTPLIDRKLIPSVDVIDDFDLLSTSSSNV